MLWGCNYLFVLNFTIILGDTPFLNLVSTIHALACKFSLLCCICCPHGIEIAFFLPPPSFFSFALSFQNYEWWINLICISAGLKKLLDSKAKEIFFHYSVFYNSVKWSQHVQKHKKITVCLNAPAFPEADEGNCSWIISTPELFNPSFYCKADSFLISPDKVTIDLHRLIIRYCGHWHLGCSSSLPKESS